jgi:IMP dehydrogenase
VVSTGWQIDANSFDLPLVAAPSDAVVSPHTAARIADLGGLAVLDGEGLWTRHEDAAATIDALCRSDVDPAALRAAYSAPVLPDLLRRRIGELRATGGAVAVRLSPQHTVELAPHVLSAGVDLLVVQGTVISAEHVGSTPEETAGGGTALNLKTFTADLDVPVIVGGCTNYQTALHLMRTGAAGVIIGYGAHIGSTTHAALGIDVPMATAIIDAAAARRDYLDETGGRYVHLIAYGDLATGGDVAKALACGADAVMLGDALAVAAEAPGAGWYWDPTAAHPRVPRSAVVGLPLGGDPAPSLEEVVLGPTSDPSGQRNLFGALRRAMGKCGYSTVKEFQKAELILTART